MVGVLVTGYDMNVMKEFFEAVKRGDNYNSRVPNAFTEEHLAELMQSVVQII